MSKRLEEYIKTNKKAFDVDSPSEELWGRIALGLDQKAKKPGKFRIWLSMAASLVVVLGIALLWTNHKKEQILEIADVNTVYGQKEMRFASLIEEKKDSLQIYAKRNPELYSQFSSDLDKMDADYHHLKQELQNSPNQRLVVRAMVKNLELQLQVISQQLSIINQVNESRKENQI